MIYNDIIWGDCLKILKTLTDNTVDLTITSPPYFQQRNYGDAQGIGNEPTKSEYLDNLLAIFFECVRVTKETGTIVFNLGDKYIEGGRKNQIDYNGFTIIKILGHKLKKDVIESPVETAKNNDHPAVYPMYII